MIKKFFRCGRERKNTVSSEPRRRGVTPQHFDYNEDVIKSITKHPKTQE